jgi:hypothetical protein
MDTLNCMVANQDTPASRAAWREAQPRLGRITGGGTTGNERLTALTGTSLLVLLAVIGVTILRLRPLLSVHLFVGMLLIGPVALKLASTGYRFVRYYTSNPTYRRKGPPPLALRLIAPLLVLSTVTVLSSGVVLLLAGPSSRETLLPIHKVSFFVWLAVSALHVLGHLPKIPRALRADYGGSAGLGSDVSGRAGRALSLSGALLGGAVLAIVVIPEFGPWLHSSTAFHHHG